ncbi:RAI2 isoform 6, partial [Pongo abelii]
MDDLQSQNLSMDMTDSPPTLANNRLENGMAQLITTEAWNINSTDLPLCLGESPVVMPIHMQVEGSSAPELNPNGNATYVMTT